VRCEGKALVVGGPGGERSLPFEELLVAVGRKPRLSGYGLEELGIDISGKLERDEFLQLRYPNIYAVGDVATDFQLTHAAAHEAWFAAVNALFGSVKRFRADYRVLPWTTFTDPEVAHVGHNEASATRKGWNMRWSATHSVTSTALLQKGRMRAS
jgi:pyruvate/2-oxoglutarate dehydrogenase complex dihydrolipoamide dehydrogenase (E3) component